MSYIEFDKVSKIYQMGEVEIKALDEISFTIEKGEFVVILGASGAGKTTILNILGGMDTATSGRIVVDDNNISLADEKQLTEYRRYDIGFVFQFYNLVQNLTARENVELALQICKFPLDPVKILKLVGLEERMNNFPSQLSGGEQQRVCIARALINHPEIILADEPTGNLDEDNENIVLDLFKQLHREGTTLIVVTHDPEVAEEAQRTVVLEHGRLVKEIINEDFKE